MASVKGSYRPGEDYFGKYDPEELEDGTTDYSSDDDNEDEIPSKKKKHKIRPLDVIIKKTREQLQDTFSETVEETLAEHPNMDTDEAVEIVYEELKHIWYPTKYLVGHTHALKRCPVHRRIKETVERLREDEDYDDDESTQYATKKRKFLIERKLDEHDPPSYEEDDEQSLHHHYLIKHRWTRYHINQWTIKQCHEKLFVKGFPL